MSQTAHHSRSDGSNTNAYADMAARCSSEQAISDYIASIAHNKNMDFVDDVLNDWTATQSIHEFGSPERQEATEDQAGRGSLIAGGIIADAIDRNTAAKVSQTAMLAAKLGESHRIEASKAASLASIAVALAGSSASNESSPDAAKDADFASRLNAIHDKAQGRLDGKFADVGTPYKDD